MANNIQKPAAINITRNPWTKKENELKIYAVSGSGAAKTLLENIVNRIVVKTNNLEHLNIIILLIKD